MRYDEMIDYLKQNKKYIFIYILALIFLSAFLISENLTVLSVLIINIVSFMILGGCLICNYLQRKRYHAKIEEMLEKLDKKYLLTDIIQFSQTIEDQFYYQVLRECNKTMLEEIYQEKKERLEYKEYIERWLHEIKNPITTVKLICDNDRTPTTTKILIEITRVNNYLEQVLFYARSSDVEKDYMIKEIDLSESVTRVLIKNKQLLIENKTKVMMDKCCHCVLTDDKWLEFIIIQIINNSIQYKRGDSLELKIFSEEIDNGIKFVIQDNGIGILESDLPRIFEKGYTGKNGRNNNNSTGLGLYLCKKLCNKLGIDIFIESHIGEGTSVILVFPKGKILEVQM